MPTPHLPGIWKLTYGIPERHTPLTILPVAPAKEALAKLGAPEKCPVELEHITFRTTSRGCLLEIPMTAKEEIYGFGLQLKSHRQSGKKKLLRVNSDPVADTGDSHAPVPFYVSTAGYGVLVDSARYMSFYSGSHQRAEDIPDDLPAGLREINTSTEQLYGSEKRAVTRRMTVEVPHAPGVDIYIFAGPSLLDAVRRYVLFCGGGALPPLWGLGIWYRVYGRFNQAETLKLAKSFRRAGMPCDVLGLEPGWQSNSYSCTYLWNKENFPEPDKLVGDLTRLGYSINLWEHAFVHPAAPIHQELKPLSGDLVVWKGLVPDFTLEKTREIFGHYHEEAFVKKGITGFKLDECDHSDFISFPWSFPEHTQFPGGVDGEQMHSLFGLLYQKTILDPFVRQNIRTLSQVRSSYAPAAHFPFVLYSDLYAHRDFVRGVVNAGFAGLLWSPEVRQCESVEDLIRRLQSVVLSPQALINSWMIPNPPWWQFEEEKNRGNIPLRGWKKVEAMVREIFELRMSLLPYLYSAFARYHEEGTPPFRALVMDHPHDPEVLNIDDQFLIGDSLLAAPMFAGEKKRRVYLPAGTWFDFFSHQKYEGGKWHEIEPELRHIPLFVMDNTLLPLAKPVLHVAPDTTFEVRVRVYGAMPRPFDLYVDDGVSFDCERGRRGWLKLSWSGEEGRAEPSGERVRELYKIVAWTRQF